jgi:hypothetical protein
MASTPVTAQNTYVASIPSTRAAETIKLRLWSCVTLRNESNRSCVPPACSTSGMR